MTHPLHVPSRPIRVVTSAALFDGHDAAINIMRRILQAQGAEVIHLGHNRSVDEVAVAAIQEDADAVAVSSYQGGHVEFFEYLVRTLRERGAVDRRTDPAAADRPAGQAVGGGAGDRSDASPWRRRAAG
jgi:methylmalonyl-CoA mutase